MTKKGSIKLKLQISCPLRQCVLMLEVGHTVKTYFSAKCLYHLLFSYYLTESIPKLSELETNLYSLLHFLINCIHTRGKSLVIALYIRFCDQLDRDQKIPRYEHCYISYDNIIRRI